MYRSPGVFIGYYKNPEATAATRTPDGWVHTGDAGVFTESGHLRVVDRAKDVGRLNDGTLFAPKYLENKLKFFPYYQGSRRLRRRARFRRVLHQHRSRRGRQLGGAARHRLHQLYRPRWPGRSLRVDCRRSIAAVNRDLAEDAALAGSQIRRFLILHKELDADDGELTRTRKVRRGTIAERYADLIAALYSDRSSVPVEAKVAFEDGRTAFIRAELKIRTVATVSRVTRRVRTGNPRMTSRGAADRRGTAQGRGHRPVVRRHSCARRRRLRNPPG